jgi:uncharacterized protein with HEPN domain
MKKEIKTYFEDVLFSINRIEHHLKGIINFSEFKNDITVYDAVERRICIIGEAIWQANKLKENLSINDKEKIIGLRHILTHDYDLVNPEIIWKILEKNLPTLKEEVEILLKD